MQWVQIHDPLEISQYDNKLIHSDSTIYQYPYWNSSLNFPFLKSRYLKCIESGEILAYLCLSQVGFSGFKFCYVNHGPVLFRPVAESSFWTSLLETLRRDYAFVRFAFQNKEDFEQIRALHEYQSEEVNSFPFHTPLRECLVVEQVSDDQEMLYKFSETARRLIRKAERVGYEFRALTTVQSFRDAWPIYESLSKRKGFSFRPLKSYLRLIQEGKENDLVRVFSAYFGKDLVQSIFVTLDGKMAWYMSGALDTTKIHQNTSPSFCLHYKAMRTLYKDKGLARYNLGSRSGKVYEFKSRFNPVQVLYPPSLTVIFNPVLYRLYSGSVLRFRKGIKRRIKKLIR